MEDATTWRQIQQQSAGAGNLMREVERGGEKLPTYDRAFEETLLPVYGSVELVDQDSALSFKVGDRFILRRDTRGLLPAFCKLADAEAPRILAFARKWGPLCLCEHHVPYGGCLKCEPPFSATDVVELFREPVEAWRCFAAAVRAAIAVSIRLYKGEAVPIEDARAALASWPIGTAQKGGKLVEPRRGVADWRSLSLLLDEWFVMAGPLRVRPWMKEGGGVTVNLIAQGLFPAIVRELTFSVAKVSGLATCSACGQIYAPTRKPRADRLNFCPDCGPRAAWRMSKRRTRN